MFWMGNMEQAAATAEQRRFSDLHLIFSTEAGHAASELWQEVLLCSWPGDMPLLLSVSGLFSGFCCWKTKNFCHV